MGTLGERGLACCHPHRPSIPCLGQRYSVAALQPRSLVSGDLLGNVCGSPPPGPQHLATVPPAPTAAPASRLTETRNSSACASHPAPDGAPLPASHSPAGTSSPLQPGTALPSLQPGEQRPRWCYCCHTGSLVLDTVSVAEGCDSGSYHTGSPAGGLRRLHCQCSVRNVPGTGSVSLACESLALGQPRSLCPAPVLRSARAPWADSCLLCRELHLGGSLPPRPFARSPKAAGKPARGGLGRLIPRGTQLGCCQMPSLRAT